MKCSSIALRNIIVSCGLLISSNAISNDRVPQPQVECNSNYRINEKDFSLVFIESNSFIFSTKYCINKLKARKVVDKRDFPDRKTVRHIVKRYNETYDALQSHHEKVEFVDLFLDQLTQKYHISLNEINLSKGTIQIIINSFDLNKSKVSGYALTLFRDDNISDGILGEFSQYLEKNGLYSHSKAISDKVNFVLEGSSKKSVNKADDYNYLFRSLAFDDDEQDDDDIEEWEEEDQEYRDWAEDQADGWGDDWDYFWEEDEDEEWLVMYNEEGDVEEAYHFSPKAD